MRKFIILLAASILCFAPHSVSADNSQEKIFIEHVRIGKFYYDLNIKDNTASVRSADNGKYDKLRKVTIPKSVKHDDVEYMVSNIRWGAFSGCKKLRSVTIPDGVTFIGEGAFEGCTKLKSVTIPSSVTKINNKAFKDCTGLTSVTIPDGVYRICFQAFYGCSGLTELTIGRTVNLIANEAFYGCTNLTSITLHSTRTYPFIKDSAFENCSNLQITYEE